MASYGLYTHIRSNRRRSVALLIGLFLLVYLMTFAGALIAEAFVDSRASFEEIVARASQNLIWSAPFVTVGTAIWIAIAYRFHQSMIDALTGGHEVTRREQPRLYNLLENLCISRGIPMPKLKIMDSAALNAFATGLNQKQYSITVTSGLVERLNDAELEAVLAHELTHIRFALSRSREFLADAGAVELTKNADAMIMALRKIENRGELDGVTSAVMEMCVDNPRAGFADMFATHPSIDSRVDALVRMAGGHDPGPLVSLPEPDPIEAAARDAASGSTQPRGPWSEPQPAPDSAPRDGPWGSARG